MRARGGITVLLLLGLAETSGAEVRYQYGVQFPAGAPRVAGPHALVFADGQDYKYDRNGNLVCRKAATQHDPSGTCAGAQATFAYNHEGKLCTATDARVTAQYLHGPGGARAGSIVNGRVTAVLDPAYEIVGGVARKHYFAGGRRIAQSEGGQLKYYPADHLGSATKVLDGSRQVVLSTDYYPFGETLRESGAFVERRRFNGRETDETGLYDYGARSYAPVLGRFWQADQVVADFARPQSLNRYAYVENNPVGFVDPSGHFRVEWDKVQLFLDGVGLATTGWLEPVGMAADVVNTGVSAGRGRWGDAAVNGLAIIPILGSVVKVADRTKDGAKVVSRAVEAARMQERARIHDTVAKLRTDFAQLSGRRSEAAIRRFYCEPNCGSVGELGRLLKGEGIEGFVEVASDAHQFLRKGDEVIDPFYRQFLKDPSSVRTEVFVGSLDELRDFFRGVETVDGFDFDAIYRMADAIF